MFINNRYRQLPDSNPQKDAADLQAIMGWGPYVTTTELEQFVLRNPQYCIIILSTVGKTFPTIPGRSYNPDARTPNGNLNPFDIYLLYLPTENHYGMITSSVEQFYKKYYNDRNLRFCTKCRTLHTTRQSCQCMGSRPKRKQKVKKCPNCNMRHQSNCNCGETRCRFCQAYITSEFDPNHRCLLMGNPYEERSKETKIWAFDIEAKLEEEIQSETIPHATLDDQHQYTTELIYYHQTLLLHQANYIYCKEIYTGETKEFDTTDCLQHFLQWALDYNEGNHRFFSFNGSGYDTRLIYEALCKMGVANNISLITRGLKMVQLQYQKCFFQDAMLHVPGSIRSLAKTICPSIVLKGFFPYRFNKLEHWDYIGSPPTLDWWDIPWICKSEEELQEFNEYYQSIQHITNWSLQQELKKYCQNDVDILVEIMRHTENTYKETFQYSDSPWFYATGPSYFHKMKLKSLAMEAEMPNPKNKDEFKEWLSKIDVQQHWVALISNEYNFARRALRGGRTEVKQLLLELTEEEWNQGYRIRYLDICSMYPSVQLDPELQYPTGVPEIHIWTDRYQVCGYHQSSESCSCTNPQPDRLLRIVEKPKPTKEELIHDPYWFGIVAATVKAPNNMVHPVLVTYCEYLNKCIATCESFEGVFTSVELREALISGYELIELHRFDRYHSGPSKWISTMKEQYVIKLQYSYNQLQPEQLNELIRDHAYYEMEDLIRDKAPQFTKNTAMKNAAKRVLNAQWGKHAQKMNMVETEIISESNTESMKTMFDNICEQNVYLKNAMALPHHHLFQYERNTKKVKLDLHSTYLPVAVFVTAYSRLKLWREMVKYGTRLLMCDTDSIVVLHKPGLYETPTGKGLGQWEIEDIDSKHGGIQKFVGLAPKTYSIKCRDGNESTKTKGISLRRNSENLVNYHVMSELMKRYLENGEQRIIKVPQQQFQYKMGKGIQSTIALKDLSIQPSHFKGILRNNYLFPFGYQDE